MKRLINIIATCGVGKSTVVNYLKDHSHSKEYVFLDSDAIGLNWHDYSEREHSGNLYFTDGLNIATELSKAKHIVIATCMNPMTYDEIKPIKGITETHFINLICSDDVLKQRLKGRPVERMTHSDEFIETQIEYMNWFRSNGHLMNLIIDSSKQSIAETALIVSHYLDQLDR